jgi:hypothetical protein
MSYSVHVVLRNPAKQMFTCQCFGVSVSKQRYIMTLILICCFVIQFNTIFKYYFRLSRYSWLEICTKLIFSLLLCDITTHYCERSVTTGLPSLLDKSLHTMKTSIRTYILRILPCHVTMMIPRWPSLAYRPRTATCWSIGFESRGNSP